MTRRPQREPDAGATAVKATATVLQPDATRQVPSLPSDRLRWWMPATLVLAGLAVYLNSFIAPFILDDDQILLALRDLREGEAWAFFFSTRRVLLHVTMWLNYQLGGEDPLGYHLVNTAIHITAGLALFGVVRRTLRLPLLHQRFGTAADGLAFAIALLWLVHPLNTQAVTYIIQRGESMMGMFFLLTLYAAIRDLEPLVSSHRRTSLPEAFLWPAIAILCCLGGMLSKEVMIAAPLAVVVYDWTLTRLPLRDLLRRRGVLYLLLTATAGVLFLPQTQAAASAGFGYESLTWWQYALTQPLVILKYLRLSLLPYPLVLDRMHPAQHTLFDHPDIPWVMALVRVSVPVLIVGVAVGSTGWALIRRRPWAMVPAWFFLILAPTSSILPIADLMVEHRMYLPLIAVVMVVVLGGYAFLKRRAAAGAPVMAGAFVLVTLVLSILTVSRNHDYRSEQAIWQTVVERAPHNPRGWHHLGSAWFAEGDREQAYACWLRTIELGPRSFPEAYLNLARIDLEAGRIDTAVARLEQGLSLRPNDLDFRLALGIAQLTANRIDEATATLEAVLADEANATPGSRRTRARAANALAGIAIRQQTLDVAQARLDEALTLDSRLVDAHVNRGTLLARQGDFERAIAAWGAALQLDEHRPDVYTNIGEVCLLRGDLARAEANLMRALEINARYAPAVQRLVQLAVKHAEQGDFPQGARLVQTAISVIQSWQGDPRQWQELIPLLEALRAGRLPGGPEQG